MEAPTTTAAGPAVCLAQPTVPFSPPLRPIVNITAETPTTTVVSTAAATPAPFDFALVVAGVVLASIILGLILLAVLALFLNYCFRKRKEAHHDKVNRFWDGMVKPSGMEEGLFPPSEPPRVVSPRPSCPDPSFFADPYADAGPSSGAPRRSYRGPTPKFLTFRKFSPLTALAMSFAAKAGFMAKGDNKAAQAAAQAHAQAGRNSLGIDPIKWGLGLGDETFEMVDICLDEDLALEEQERTERRHMHERATWDAARRSLSPFPKPPPTLRPSKSKGKGKQLRSFFDD